MIAKSFRPLIRLRPFQRVLLAAFCAALFLSTAARAQPGIVVGKNVQVSAALGSYSLGEIFLAADPVKQDRLLACSVVYAERENRRWTAVFSSVDRGQSWIPTLQTRQFHDSADPSCTLGVNDVASHVAIEIGRSEGGPYGLAVFRSADGGRTWTTQRVLPMRFEGIDNQFMTTDVTHGKYRGNFYVSGTSWVRTFDDKERNAFALWSSNDAARSYHHPIKRMDADHHYVLGISNNVVMSDGTLVMMFGDLTNSDGNTVPKATPSHPNAELDVVTSNDGGDSMSPATKVDDFFFAWDGAADSEPSLAVDRTRGPFRNRLYAIRSDLRTGRAAIYVSHSDDKGQTWSKAFLVDDAEPVGDPVRAPNNFMPTVAVNNNGVVGVAWYDRRDFPNNDGWQLRFATSSDGGDTWSASLPVAEVANTYNKKEHLFLFAAGTREGTEKEASGHPPVSLDVNTQVRQFNAGDYAGLVADTGGLFHALWIDNRTGLSQVWTAPIEVSATAQKFGSPALSSFDDVSPSVSLIVDNSNWDRENNTVTVATRVRNIGKKSVRGPFKLRLLTMTSELARRVEVDGASNGVTGPGAVLDFSSAVPGGELKPHGFSNTYNLMFHLVGPKQLSLTGELKGQVVHMDAQVIAHASK